MRVVLAASLILVVLAGPVAAEESVETLVGKLGSENSADAYAAYRVLLERKDSAAIPLIVARVHAWKTFGQSYGVRVIENLRHKRTEAALRRLLKNESPYVTVCAATALWRQGHRDMGPVFTKAVAATEANESDLVLVLNAMSTYDMPEARKIARRMVTTLERPYPFSRVVFYLNSVGGDDEAMPIVEARLEDGCPAVRGLAAAYLYRFGRREFAPVLAEAIRTGIEYSPFLTINTLLSVSGAIAREILEALAERVDEETASGYVTSILRLLAKGGYSGLAPILEKRIDDDNTVISKTALELLMSTSGSVNRESLVALLESDDDAKRLIAAEALRRTDDLAGLDVVLEIVRDNPTQRAEAIRILGGFRTRAAVVPLLDALADPVNTVRMNAYSALRSVLQSLFPYRRFDLSSTGYTYGASEDERRLGLERLRTWWAANKDRRW